MATLYVGNGNVEIQGENIVGIEINYKGKLEIEKECGDDFHIEVNSSKILIFPLSTNVTLNKLFCYKGVIEIKDIIVSDNNAIQVPCTIKKVLDYAELLDSNAEDITTYSEKLKSSAFYGKLPLKTKVKNQEPIDVNIKKISRRIK